MMTGTWTNAREEALWAELLGLQALMDASESDSEYAELDERSGRIVRALSYLAGR
jgi:hypothetical protein